MSKKKQEIVFKLNDLLAGPFSSPQFSFNGFSVSTTINIPEFDFLKDHFRSDFFAILLIVKGKAEMRINLQNHSLRKNDLLVFSPHTIKQFVKASKDSIGIGISFTAHFLNQAGLPKNSPELFDYFATRYSPHWQLKTEDAAILKTRLQALEQPCQMIPHHPYGKEILYHTFFNFMYEMAALAPKYTQASNQQLSRKEDLVMRFGSLVNKHFRSQRGVQYYANLLHVTPKYLTETVKEVSGKNAGEIIDDFVVLEAKVFLENPELSIAEIAEKLHFSDQSFFGKFFKRHTGVSPKSYRHSALI